MILTTLSSENPSNIEPQMCGTNKLTGKMELVLLRDKWIPLFGYGTFQRYVFMLSTRFVWTSGNSLNCLTKHGATFSSLYIARRTYWCSGCDEHACDTIVLSLCWKLMNQSLKLMVITFCRKRPSSVIGFLAIWAHKHAGKHMFSVNNCCLHFSISVTFLDIFCWIDWVIISEFHRWLRTINSYRHHNFGKFC